MCISLSKPTSPSRTRLKTDLGVIGDKPCRLNGTTSVESDNLLISRISNYTYPISRGTERQRAPVKVAATWHGGFWQGTPHNLIDMENIGMKKYWHGPARRIVARHGTKHLLCWARSFVDVWAIYFWMFDQHMFGFLKTSENMSLSIGKAFFPKVVRLDKWCRIL